MTPASWNMNPRSSARFLPGGSQTGVGSASLRLRVADEYHSGRPRHYAPPPLLCLCSDNIDLLLPYPMLRNLLGSDVRRGRCPNSRRVCRSAYRHAVCDGWRLACRRHSAAGDRGIRASESTARAAAGYRTQFRHRCPGCPQRDGTLLSTSRLLLTPLYGYKFRATCQARGEVCARSRWSSR